MPPLSTGRTRARLVLLALVAGWVLGGGTSASAAEGARQEGETVCTGGSNVGNAADSGGLVRYTGTTTITCPVPGTGSFTLRIYGRQLTSPADGTFIYGGTSYTFVQPAAAVVSYQQLNYTGAVPVAGGSSFQITRQTGSIYVDFYTLEPSPEPTVEPSPSVAPTTEPTVEPSPSVAPTTTTEPTVEPTTPPPSPEPTVEPSPVAPPPGASPVYLASGSSPDGAPVMVLHPEQFTAFGVGLVLLVLLNSAVLVSQVRRGRA